MCYSPMILHISLCSNVHVTDDSNVKVSVTLTTVIAVFYYVLKVAAIIIGIEVCVFQKSVKVYDR